MHVELCEDGLVVGGRRVAGLMRENGLKAHQKQRYKRMTDSHHDGPVALNILDQDFVCDGPDQKWGADISYIWTAEGWLYLAIVLDLFSRRIVGWATRDRLKKDLAIRALRKAIAMRSPPPGLIHHSDRGSQYCSIDYRRLLQSQGFIASMSGKGNCYDNAQAECFYHQVVRHSVRNFPARYSAAYLVLPACQITPLAVHKRQISDVADQHGLWLIGVHFFQQIRACPPVV